MATSKSASNKNIQNLLNKGVQKSSITGYGKNLNTKEMNKILGSYQTQGQPTQAPQTQTAPPPDPYAQLKSLQSAYQGTMAPSADETSAEASLKNIAYGKELGTQDAATQAVPVGFITGQQKAIENAAAIKSMPLEAQLKLMQEKRQSQSDIAKSAVDFEQTRMQDYEKQREFGLTQAEQERSDKAQESISLKSLKSQEKISKDTLKATKSEKAAALSSSQSTTSSNNATKIAIANLNAKLKKAQIKAGSKNVNTKIQGQKEVETLKAQLKSKGKSLF